MQNFKVNFWDLKGLKKRISAAKEENQNNTEIMRLMILKSIKEGKREKPFFKFFTEIAFYRLLKTRLMFWTLLQPILTSQQLIWTE